MTILISIFHFPFSIFHFPFHDDVHYVLKPPPRPPYDTSSSVSFHLSLSPSLFPPLFKTPNSRSFLLSPRL